MPARFATCTKCGPTDCVCFGYTNEPDEQPTPPQAPKPKNDDVDRLLHELFAVCEATEDECAGSDNNFNRGRAFEAKRIRRGVGTWFQDTFCGQSFMGEPVLPATPTQAPEEVDPQLPRKLLDVACRMRVGETLYRDDELVDAAAHALRTALTAQAAEVARLTAEAARYRWLRDHSEPSICAFYLSVGEAFKGVKFARETVDEAIDAQIAAMKEQTNG